MPDPFPAQTRGTWIEARLASGAPGRAAVNHHVMSLYAEGLKAYYLGSSFFRHDRGRTLGPAEDVVAGFFADRLDRVTFLDAWRASGKRLRHWLINAFRFHLQERLRGERESPATGPLPDGLGADDEDPTDAYHRAYAQALVQRALGAAKEECAARDLAVHWSLFERRYVDGLPPRRFLAEFGLDSVRAAGMIRVARNHFERVLRGLLGHEHDSFEEIGAELVDLRHFVRSTGGGGAR